jgi:hypothetical protein
MELLHGHSLNEGGVCTACGCGRAFISHFKLKCRSASPPETHNTDEIRNGLVATLAARKLRLELDEKASRAELAQEFAALTERLDRIEERIASPAFAREIVSGFEQEIAAMFQRQFANLETVLGQCSPPPN